jgi:MFS transporter, DHA2 family, multidrug resistance protein
MSATEQSSQTQEKTGAQILTSLSGALPAEISVRPVMGMAGVALGAMIGTINGRLLSVGLPDIRGAMGLGLDEASWIPTVLNMGMMFIGPFSVFLGGLLGARKVLLLCATILIVVSVALPFAPNFPLLLVLEVIAGITAGSFYPLAMSFILRNLPVRYSIFAIAMYAAAIDFSTNAATSLHAWYMQHLSWHWDFWTTALLTPLMMWLVHKGIPPSPPPSGKGPRPSWLAFLYGSFGLAFLYGALDQGERLDWLNSGTVVAILSVAAFLLTITVVHRLRTPNPLVDLPFLRQRNTLLMAAVLFIFRFVLLSTIILIPQYLGGIRGLRPEQIGAALLWVALPQLPLALLTALFLRRFDSRLPLAVGFFLVAIACFMNSHLSSAWDRGDFVASQIVMAFGQSMAFTSVVASWIMQAFYTGAISKPQWILTFSAFVHTIRLFGGECGVSLMGHFLSVREKLHSNLIGLHVDTGSWLVQQRLSLLTAALAPDSSGADGASGRAVGLLALQVSQQAHTQALIDGFVLCEWAVLICLLVVLCMHRTPITYGDLDIVPGRPASV